jgi:hypothetical protein
MANASIMKTIEYYNMPLREGERPVIDRPPFDDLRIYQCALFIDQNNITNTTQITTTSNTSNNQADNVSKIIPTISYDFDYVNIKQLITLFEVGSSKYLPAYMWTINCRKLNNCDWTKACSDNFANMIKDYIYVQLYHEKNQLNIEMLISKSARRKAVKEYIRSENIVMDYLSYSIELYKIKSLITHYNL